MDARANRAFPGAVFPSSFCWPFHAAPPVTAGTVVPTGNPAVARFSHTATLLPNNKVLIAGGMERNGVWLDSPNSMTLPADISAPRTRWIAAVRRHGHAAGQCKVLIAGGSDGSAEAFPQRKFMTLPATLFPGRAK